MRPTAIRETSIAFIAALVATAVVDWQAISNGFQYLHGDRFDAVIVVTILEHWFHVYQGERWWNDAYYFFPYANTIAQTDAYFLASIPYAVFRWAGMDPFLSSHFSGLALKVVGFLGMFAFGRLAGGWRLSWALAAATVFTLSNGMTSHGQRLQLATVAIAPVLATLLHLLALSVLSGNKRKTVMLGAASSALFGAWCISCFYMAWFFAYLYLFAIVFMLLLSSKQNRSLALAAVRSSWKSASISVLVLILSLSPFISAYLPKAQESGVRKYDAVAANLLSPGSVMQIGSVNYLLGNIYGKISGYLDFGYSLQGEYYNTGINPILFALFLICGFMLLRSREPQASKIQIVGLFLAALACWVSAIRIGDYSLWWITFHVIPGAKALNAVAALQLMLAFPVVVVTFHVLAKTEWGMPKAKPYLAVPLCTVLFAAELNQPSQHLDRREELQRVADVPPAPSSCKSFYVSAWPGQANATAFPEWINGFYAHNVTAMLIAQMINLPTVNGVASFNPPDWNFGFPWQSDYDARIRAYAQAHSVAEGLCKFDLEARSWSDLPKP